MSYTDPNWERKTAEKHADEALDGDDVSLDLRARKLAYAQVSALLYLGDQVARIAEVLEDRMQ